LSIEFGRCSGGLVNLNDKNNDILKFACSIKDIQDILQFGFLSAWEHFWGTLLRFFSLSVWHMPMLAQKNLTLSWGAGVLKSRIWLGVSLLSTCKKKSPVSGLFLYFIASF
jgi:hypothetical protein